MKKKGKMFTAMLLAVLLGCEMSVTVMAAQMDENISPDSTFTQEVNENDILGEPQNPEGEDGKQEDVKTEDSGNGENTETEESTGDIGKKEPPVLKGIWHQDGKGWWYENPDGSYSAGKWQLIDEEMYYFNAEGYMLTGWQYYKNIWYYLDGSGAMATGWLNLGGTWYYMNQDGAMQTGWALVGDTWYYLQESGAMQTGWLYRKNIWYYLDGSGAMVTGWLNLGGTWYYMNQDGAMQTGWALVGDTWYYLDGSGAMQTGWLYLKNVWYYLDGSGAMATGWLNLGGTWYYMNQDGAMQTGWVFVKGEWYYLSGSGAMATGWLHDGKHWYYLYPSGAMAKNTVIDGYTIEADGIWEDPTSALLQQLVDQVIAQQTTAAMSQEGKLRALYQYMSSRSVFTYRRIYPLQDLFEGWEVVNAYEMLSTHSGNCYHFGSAFGMLARGIGYDARIINGQITAARGGFTPHCWVEIDMNGVTYLFDCEMEHAKGYDLYKKTYGSVGLTYLK
ncbi:MAG: transglutaminase domain-containing protein [Lachnospiraceae bacterium]|jgi:glucan-binding YG repeat protein